MINKLTDVNKAYYSIVKHSLSTSLLDYVDIRELADLYESGYDLSISRFSPLVQAKLIADKSELEVALKLNLKPGLMNQLYSNESFKGLAVYGRDNVLEALGLYNEVSIAVAIMNGYVPKDRVHQCARNVTQYGASTSSVAIVLPVWKSIQWSEDDLTYAMNHEEYLLLAQFLSEHICTDDLLESSAILMVTDPSACIARIIRFFRQSGKSMSSLTRSVVEFADYNLLGVLGTTTDTNVTSYLMRNHAEWYKLMNEKGILKLPRDVRNLFMHSLATNKSKFIKLMLADTTDLESFHNTLLVEPSFYRNVNVNSVTVKSLLKLLRLDKETVGYMTEATTVSKLLK